MTNTEKQPESKPNRRVSIFDDWRYRIGVYIFLTILLSAISLVEVALLGTLLAIIIALIMELISTVRSDLLGSVNNKQDQVISSVNSKQDNILKDINKSNSNLIKNVNTEIKGNLYDAKLINELTNDLLKIREDPHLSRLFQLNGDSDSSQVSSKFQVVLLPKESLESSIDNGLDILATDSSTALRIWQESFSTVDEYYWGVSFVGETTEEFEGQRKFADLAQKELVKKLKDSNQTLVSSADRNRSVRRVFVFTNESNANEMIKAAEAERERTGIEATCISLSRIRQVRNLKQVWDDYFSLYFDESRQEDFMRIPLISPDFAIIDNRLMISYLLDKNRQQVGAAIHFEANLLEKLKSYHVRLFEAAQEYETTKRAQITEGDKAV